MVRNLGILNMELSIPTLSDQNKTGPIEVSLIISAMTSMTGDKKNRKITAIVKLNTRIMII
jgi:hypothetical protein